MNGSNSWSEIDPNEDLIYSQHYQDECFGEEKGGESCFFADKVEGLVIGLHKKVQKIDAVDCRREDTVEGVSGSIFEDDDVHV